MPGAAGTAGDIKPGTGSVSVGWRNVYANQYFLNSHVYKSLNRIEKPTRLWNTLDVTGTYQLTKRVNLQMTVPIQMNQASFLLPSNPTGNPMFRQYLSTAGVGDLLLIERTWLLDPDQAKKGNLLLGFGLKLPTGDYRGNNTWNGGNIAAGYARRPAPLTILIGDGGVDVLTELLGFKVINFPVKNTNLFAVGSYLITPKNTTGIASQNLMFGPPISTSPFTQNSLVNTVGDSYSVRTGMVIPWPKKESKLRGLSGLVSYRWEGTPQYDLIGRSDGFRQPGFFMAAELGLFYQKKRHLIQATCPISFVRYAAADGGELKGSPAPRTTAFSPASLNVRYTYYY